MSLLCAAILACGMRAAGETAAFDLIGPNIDVRVQRAGKTLPVSQVPNLQAGDRLWVHPDLPDTQSVHYLMVIVFLRGATNPPPESWFTRVETWNKAVHEEGVYVTVPGEAEEAIVLLAPESGGAFGSLRTAVRGKPGAFVRAAQDLLQASLDRTRLEKYLEAVRQISASDPDQLKTKTTLLARSLNIRLDQQCFDKPSAQQVPCLTQNTDQLVLDDAHSQTMVATLTTGAPTDLLAQLSSTPTAGRGYYSPYIGAVVDVIRILGTAHSPQYQYIPALALPKQDTLNLRLNNPPSFRNPKSVLVVGLPPVRPTVAPPLRAVDPAQISCLSKSDLVLATEGAPLVFATDMAHDLRLHVESKSRPSFDLPAKADGTHGGFAVDINAIPPNASDSELTGTLRGGWGFENLEGPHFRLRLSHPAQWTVASKDSTALIVGREDSLHIHSADACCVSEVLLEDENGKPTPLEWKVDKHDELEIKVPLQNASAGPLKIFVKKFGLREPDEVSLHTYAEASRLDSFSIHAGDSEGVLKGTRLDEVTALVIDGITFNPENLTRANQQDELRVVTHDASAAAVLDAALPITVRVALMDGRTLSLNTTVEAARPRVTLLSKSVSAAQGTAEPVMHLSNPDELPQDRQLNFFLKSEAPENFSATEKIEVATSDEAFHGSMSIQEGSLTLQDSQTVLAVLDPIKLLGPSAFGPLKFRAITGDGVPGEWQPLVNLVRMPELKTINCPAAKTLAKSGALHQAGQQELKPVAKEEVPDLADGNQAVQRCVLTGEKLFLVDAVSINPDFTDPVTVPQGFIQTALEIPQPKTPTLYVKLRDDPAAVNTATLPIVAQP